MLKFKNYIAGNRGVTRCDGELDLSMNQMRHCMRGFAPPVVDTGKLMIWMGYKLTFTGRYYFSVELWEKP